MSKRPYTRPEVNIKIVRNAAQLLLSAGGSQDTDRGVRALRDLLIVTIQMRRRKLLALRAEGSGRGKGQTRRPPQAQD
jgi:hypothetical protein